MSTLQYYRLALLQWVRYQQSIEQIITLQSDIAELQNKVALHQKKHRRCDRQIDKHQQCGLCDKKYGSQVALKLHRKLKHGGVSGEESSSGGGLQEMGGEDKENRRNN